MEDVNFCKDESIFMTSVALSPPLITQVDNTTGGLLLRILNDVIRTCCHGNASVGVTRVARSPQELYSGITDDEQIILPYHQSETFEYHVINASFLPVLTSPGMVLLVRNTNQLYNLMSILTVSWQLLIVIAITCCLAGIIIWLLERLSYPDTLPKRFHQGLWEGVWWSFVSMTTVGYGDITPKSILGRLFAMLWIIIGICIFTIFTATLTAAVTQQENSKNTVHGKKIAVLNGTEELHFATLLGANPIVFPSIEALVTSVPFAIRNGHMEGVLLDYVHLSQVSQVHDVTSLRTLLDITIPRTHGILFQQIDPNLISCFHKAGRSMRYNAVLTSTFSTNKMLQPVSGVDSLGNWLTIRNDHLAIYAACLLAVVLACILWECLYLRPKLLKQERMSNQQEVVPKEVNAICCTCSKQIRNVFS